ncbi:MAG: ribonuclease J [Deltaproteobacteria bacterium]|jgi:ribonuclease J|nr:ribonuclease J [Deltaproteobacteria bacterium]
MTDIANPFTGSDDPREKGEPFVDVIPLGGLGEIGLNSLAILEGDAIIVVDAGLMFPGPGQPGVELVIPDFTFLIENRERLLGIILTHGHEDHIGALPFLVKECPGVPVFGTKLTLSLAAERFLEQRIELPRLIEIKPRETLALGPFEIEFIKVAHSILDGVGLAIKTRAGTIIHTGDFKMDHSAPESDRLDLYKFSEHGEKGVLALLSDSTNSDAEGHSVSEKEVGIALSRIFSEAEGRIILACFASSLTRIREVAKAAEFSGRKLVFDGRSMINNVRLARELGCLKLPPDAEVSFEDAQSLDDRELAIVVTGSQGEPLSALARMANGDHRQVVVRPGDTIIFSARAIPGNETAINTLINSFRQLGAEVMDPRYHKVHASGHGHVEELKLMLALTKPHFLIPVHGELRHLYRHRDLATDLGLPEDRALILRNGNRVSLFRDKTREMKKPVVTGRHLVEGNRLGTPGDPVLRSRRKLSEFGIVSVFMALDRETLDLLAPPKVSILGVHYANEEDLTHEAEEIAAATVARYAAEGGAADRALVFGDVPQALNDRIKADVRGLFRQSINRKPMIHPQIILVDKDNRSPS